MAAEGPLINENAGMNYIPSDDSSSNRSED